MTTVSAAGTSNIESWMVSKLFGPSSQDQNGDPTTASAATSIATVAAGSGTSVSGTTAQALAKLQTGGDAVALNAAPTQTSVPMSAVQSNAIVAKVNKMTSPEVNSAMYGNGLPTPGDFTDTRNTTFADIIALKNESINGMYQAAQDPNLSDSVRQSILDEATQTKSLVNDLQTAFNNHTLVFQKASDVSGLDYQGSYVYADDSYTPGSNQPSAPVSRIAATGTYNFDFVSNNPDKQNHALLDASGLTMFVTW